MKRKGNLWTKIIDKSNLYLANVWNTLESLNIV